MATTQIKDGFNGGSDNQLKVNADGSINTGGTSTVTGTVNTNLNGLGSFKTTQYTVGVAAVQLAPTPLAGRTSLSVKVITAASQDTVYIGTTSGVLTTTGYVLFNGDSVQLDLTAVANIYAIASAAGQRVFVLEEGS